MVEKSEIRRRVSQSFKNMDEAVYLRSSAALHKHLKSSELWERAQVIGITVATNQEVATMPLILSALQEGKRVALPAVDKGGHMLHFYFIDDLTDIQTGFAGIKEPRRANEKQVNSDDIDLLIVPGFAFTNDGYRIGYGGGYYDRFLANWNGITCSFVFPFQTNIAFPVEEHDIPVQYLVCEDGLRKC
ncbi:5-formyltetrahydrofolate cyclo-ligase [Salsuginibacillus kocurii]|uniref:5-formyltetrahydrofolate cyclo-ligase n=1 Tax=Salsuginibacillus kocurii TaxID=427078 RepID=UPI00036B587E|nr:5-formyltetrahydrofolate cyclo-ligase [Salsuginibacillus kocurii]